MFNSKALSIPYEDYAGILSFTPKHLNVEEAYISNKNLKKYADHLVELAEAKELPCDFDIKRLQSDISKGLVFDSSIPQGYGLGSSGALLAAIYDNYAVNPLSNTEKLSEEQMKELKGIFAKLESYFHGSSSGLDPLICYLRRAILVQNKESLGDAGVPEFDEKSEGAIFLIDTKQIGETKPLVKQFLANCQHENFFKMVKNEFIEYNNECINAMLNKDVKGLFKGIKKLSRFALDNMTPMIPKEFRMMWRKGVDTGSYYMKLCGSGGGGFLLGFTEDIEKTKEELKDFDLKIVKKL